MKIVTPTNILLDNNIISIYTSVSKFLNAIDNCEVEGFLRVKQEDKVKLKSSLNVDNERNESHFLGVFYTIDPFEVDIDIFWTVIEGDDVYNSVLASIGHDDMLIIDPYTAKNLGEDSQYVTTITQEYDESLGYAEDELDEYDEEEYAEDDEEVDEDDLELIHDCLENWDGEDDEPDAD